MSIIQLILYFIVPILILKYHNIKLTRWIGAIGSAYLLGIILALILYLVSLLGFEISFSSDIGEIASHVAISLAIPLLLFSSNLVEAKKLSKIVLQSFALLVLSAILVSSIVFYLYGKNVQDGAILSGMAIGVYTGGTPNLNAIASIFGLDRSLLLSANLADMVIGALFYIFLLVGAKPLLKRVLKNGNHSLYMKEDTTVENFEELDLPKFKFTKKLLISILVAFWMVLVGALLGIGLWVFSGAVDGRMNDYLVPVLMISVTVFGVIGSFNKSIRNTPHMNVVGQYLILVFSFALASSIDFSKVQDAFGVTLVLYGSITVGVFFVHMLFARMFKVDADCMIVTLTAGLYGPAFIPAITRQIKNDDLTAPGLITGSIGYAIGTFLGMILVYVYLL
jgi:uncharacterized membrane protein